MAIVLKIRHASIDRVNERGIHIRHIEREAEGENERMIERERETSNYGLHRELKFEQQVLIAATNRLWYGTPAIPRGTSVHTRQYPGIPEYTQLHPGAPRHTNAPNHIEFIGFGDINGHRNLINS
jgi:hypothetical protein